MEPLTISDVPIPILDTTTASYNAALPSANNPEGSIAAGSALSPTTLPCNPPPTTSYSGPQIAVDVISDSLDTASRRILGAFTFGTVGGIQIGTFSFGIEGQITISPDGIVAEDINGDTTFALDGTTGDAVFKGTVRAGSLISGDLTLGGAGNGSGTFDLVNGSDQDIIHMDNGGFTAYNASTAKVLATINSLGFTAYDDSFIISSSAAGGTVAGIGADGSGNTYFTAGGFGTSELNIGFNLVNVTNNFQCRALQVNGVTKTAIVPVLIEDKIAYRALYTNESPEVWFMDFAKNERSIDPLFLKVTEGEMHIIECKDGSLQVWRHRKGYEKERFGERTIQEYTRNNDFWDTPRQK